MAGSTELTPASTACGEMVPSRPSTAKPSSRASGSGDAEARHSPPALDVPDPPPDVGALAVGSVSDAPHPIAAHNTTQTSLFIDNLYGVRSTLDRPFGPLRVGALGLERQIALVRGARLGDLAAGERFAEVEEGLGRRVVALGGLLEEGRGLGALAQLEQGAAAEEEELRRAAIELAALLEDEIGAIEHAEGLRLLAAADERARVADARLDGGRL